MQKHMLGARSIFDTKVFFKDYAMLRSCIGPSLLLSPLSRPAFSFFLPCSRDDLEDSCH